MMKSTPSEIIGLANSQHPTLGHQTRVKLIFDEIVGENNIKQAKTIKIA